MFAAGERILRAVSPRGGPRQAREFLESAVFARLVGSGRLIRTWIAPEEPSALGIERGGLLLENERVRLVPYEWPFGALRAAPLPQLDLHLALLEHGFSLADACSSRSPCP